MSKHKPTAHYDGRGEFFDTHAHLYDRRFAEDGRSPEEILVANESECIRIPMLADERSINLCNSVSIVLYEALRQNDFGTLSKYGELHRLSWKQE